MPVHPWNDKTRGKRPTPSCNCQFYHGRKEYRADDDNRRHAGFCPKVYAMWNKSATHPGVLR